MKRVLVVFAGVLSVIFMPITATAHHLFLQDGTCVAVGASNEVRLPDGTLLDLLPDAPRDEFGVSFVGVARATPILRGPCPASAATADSDKK